MPKLKLDERIVLAREAMNDAASERLARADAIWHPSDEEYARIIDQWTYKPTVSRPVQVWCAIVGGVLFLGALWYVLYILNGGTL
jgi:hypothetical protein